MRTDGLVSIVVPVYKVEAYLRRCLDSILGQTYRNIEVIVVNDGSPDKSGQIADIYQAAEPRVHVIHKENGGLSDARNHGVKHVSGEYTMFVDSDDWLEKTAVETMIHHSVTYQADVVQSAFYYAYDDRLLVDDRHHAHTDPPLLLKNRALMYELVINERVKNFAWGKLYKTELIHDIPFKKGVLFEDVFWAHQVMHRVRRFLIVHQPLCFYYQRDDSIVAAYTRNILIC
ncbi:putative glycosyltransferase EpsJ [Lentibacillus sp. JNUCC-1]|uniref:glycosyltransferase family 2 protein n=1 Tax=Lentibacillus sp. JNUCC-1 TaxID=2654513 RepID=UPI00132BB944|nr:glycosyltransferase family 2 protein [Lentibacillus sp. JNUCC-1]MUV36909.1 putative glycosyltransferase EpsJ [Lentibacillus sp. JNUCC-1]